jgi:hypothetical protein
MCGMTHFGFRPAHSLGATAGLAWRPGALGVTAHSSRRGGLGNLASGNVTLGPPVAVAGVPFQASGPFVAACDAGVTRR